MSLLLSFATCLGMTFLPMAPVGTLDMELEAAPQVIGTLNLSLEDGSSAPTPPTASTVSPTGPIGSLSLTLEDAPDPVGALGLRLEGAEVGTLSLELEDAPAGSGSLSIELE